MSLPPGVLPEPTKPGQVSVWDFPRPPQVEPGNEHVTVRFRGQTICDTTSPVLVMETSHPPTYYLPIRDFVDGALRPGDGSSVCEFKGRATYFDIVGADGKVAVKAAWTYPNPTVAFAPIRDHVAVYAQAMDECLVDGERVEPQPGGFYGGWITSKVAGPFKGVPGSQGW
jgi:uncharacterized protein (DUF427 family)